MLLPIAKSAVWPSQLLGEILERRVGRWQKVSVEPV
jgi:hypothetical protein